MGESTLSNSESVTLNLPSSTETTPADVSFPMVFMSIGVIAILAEIKKKRN